MRGIGWEQEQGALLDGNILERGWISGCVDGLEKHRSSMLIEELRGGVNVVVCSRVGAADNHDGVAGCGRGGRVVDAVVIYWRLKEMRIGFEPVTPYSLVSTCMIC